MVMCVIDVGENSKKLSVNMLGGRREVLREITTYVTTTLLMALLIKQKKSHSPAFVGNTPSSSSIFWTQVIT